MVQNGGLQCFSAKSVVDAILFTTTRSYCGLSSHWMTNWAPDELMRKVSNFLTTAPNTVVKEVEALRESFGRRGYRPQRAATMLLGTLMPRVGMQNSKALNMRLR
jgi:hypothetical protein